MCKAARLAMLLLATLLAPAHAEDLQDPTRPSTLDATPEQAQAAQSLVLTAIRIAPTQLSALINNRTLRVGDSIGDARVLAIGASGVRLRRGADEFTLQLLPLKVKQAHRAAGR